MKKNRYLSTAPKSVIEEYEDTLQVLEKIRLDPSDGFHLALYSERTEILSKLLTNSNMNPVWSTLAKEERKLGACQKDFDEGYRLFWLNVVYGLHTPEEIKIAPEARKEKGEDLIKSLRVLSREAKKFGIGTNLLEYFCDEELYGMNLFLRGYGLEADHQKVMEQLSILPVLPEYRISIPFKPAPTLSELLDRVSDNLQNHSLITGKVVDRPGTVHGKWNHFIETLASHFHDRYGRYYYAGIANTANVFSKEKDSVLIGRNVKDIVEKLFKE